MGSRVAHFGTSGRCMFSLIGHSTSFEAARRKAMELGFDHIAEGDLDVWCSAPPQLWSMFRSRVGRHHHRGATSTPASCPKCSAVSRRRVARCSMRWSWLRRKTSSPLRWFHLHHFREFQPAPEPDRSQHNPGLASVHDRKHPHRLGDLPSG